MAIVAMKKLTLIGLTNEKKLILEALHYTNCVELKQAETIPGTELRFEEAALTAVTDRRQRLEKAIELIESRQAERAQEAKRGKYREDDYKKPKKPLFAYRRQVSFNEFNSISAKEYELFDVVDKLEKHVQRLTEMKAEETRLINQREQLKDYLSVNVPFSAFSGTKNTHMLLGQIADAHVARFREGAARDELLYIAEFGTTSAGTVTGVIFLRDDADNVKQLLADVNFSECPFRFPVTAQQKTEEIIHRLTEFKRERAEILKAVTDQERYLDDLKLLSDYYTLEQHKTEAAKSFPRTQTSFVLQAWFPTDAEEAVRLAVSAKTEAAMLFVEDPGEDEEAPTLTRNPKLVAPYESVTNMFSVPRATERDPNFFVAMFFFLFFGIMLSDAGYGIVLTVATLIIIKAFKMEKPMQQMILVLCMGGVSTIIWGAVFGTWFGVDVTQLPVLKYVSWFNPLEEPMLMLILCLGLGLFQILFGMGISAAESIKRGRFFDAFSDVFTWYIFFIGVFILLAGMFIPNAPKVLSTAGLAVAGGGLGLVFLTAGRKKKGIIGKILGGFGGLYNIVNFLSDILSYSRLFGLGVATGVIGFTMNLLAGIVFDIFPPLMWIGSVLILAGGHLFNLAINLLGAYIHNSRLQYVEFFGRFFEGGGYEFQPLGWDTQYVTIK